MRKILAENANKSALTDLTPDEKNLHTYFVNGGFTPKFADDHILSVRKEVASPDYKRPTSPGDNQSPEAPEMPHAEALNVAEDPGTHPKILRQLAKHSSPEIRGMVAGNANTPLEDVLHLANNGHHETAATNPMLMIGYNQLEQNPDALIQAAPKLMNTKHFNENPEDKNDFIKNLHGSRNGRIKQAALGIAPNPNLNTAPKFHDLNDFSFDAENMSDDDFMQMFNKRQGFK